MLLHKYKFNCYTPQKNLNRKYVIMVEVLSFRSIQVMLLSLWTASKWFPTHSSRFLLGSLLHNTRQHNQCRVLKVIVNLTWARPQQKAWDIVFHVSKNGSNVWILTCSWIERCSQLPSNLPNSLPVFERARWRINPPCLAWVPEKLGMRLLGYWGGREAQGTGSGFRHAPDLTVIP